MEVIITKDPEDIVIEPSIIDDIESAVNTIIKLYEVDENEVSITLTNDEIIHNLNRDYRGIDRPTDVLSFAFRESSEPEVSGGIEMLGEIIISVERAKKQAEDYGHSIRREIVFLTVHGMLHLLGYDHIDEEDRLEMEREQDFIMEKIGITRNANLENESSM